MGLTSLIISCYQGHLPVVKFLLDNDATIDLPNNNGETAFWISCAVGKLEIMKMLLNYGAIIEKSDKFGVTPLMISIMKNHLKIAKFLLSKNANSENAKSFFKEIEEFQGIKILDQLEMEIDEENHLTDDVDAIVNTEEIEQKIFKSKFMKY